MNHDDPNSAPARDRVRAAPNSRRAGDHGDDTRGPVDVLRDGALKASIWKAEGEKGPFFTAKLTRAYKDQDGQWRETQSLSASDLLPGSELLKRAYHRMKDLRKEHAQTRPSEQKRTAHRRSRRAPPQPERGFGPER